MPFVILTKTPLTQKIDPDALVSQLDIAPTILDLMNIEPPQAFFGHSLFADEPRTIFDVKEDYVAVTTPQGVKITPLNSSAKKDRPLLEMLTTFPQP